MSSIYSQAKKWHKSLREGREDVNDEARSGFIRRTDRQMSACAIRGEEEGVVNRREMVQMPQDRSLRDACSHKDLNRIVTTIDYKLLYLKNTIEY
ncbi:hypothetical protein NQ318_020325 [Aromia moschata]|uniref:Uncharacterized protein n=1 Tax=Aromia moschata TaxID=1265417 RepID=A0AAV8XDT5_9CUCU|nr:hypothetical protein NQ318_020325 [Aromia moschata]